MTLVGFGISDLGFAVIHNEEFCENSCESYVMMQNKTIVVCLLWLLIIEFSC
jgi:hypothetical protein